MTCENWNAKSARAAARLPSTEKNVSSPTTSRRRCLPKITGDPPRDVTKRRHQTRPWAGLKTVHPTILNKATDGVFGKFDAAADFSARWDRERMNFRFAPTAGNVMIPLTVPATTIA